MNHQPSRIWLPALVAVGALVLGACAGDPEPTNGNGDTPPATTAPGENGNGEISGSLVFWTPQTSPERLAVQEGLAAQFEEATGVTVEVVPMAGADQNQALVTGAASGNVPDIILHAPDQTAAWNAQGLLDTDIAARVVEDLDPSTFSDSALDFVTLDGQVAAVPSDGWSHVIVYRTDLFEAAGVDVPQSLEELADAAEALAATGVTGMALGTQAGTPSASEAIESILLTGGCQLFDNGTVTFESPECIDGLAQFQRLAESSLAGDFDVPAAQAAYLNGDAAMLLFSTHILDELAGMDQNTPVTCAECGENPRFLAENSDFITVLNPNAPAQYGTILNYGIPVGANAEAAGAFVEFLLSDGYVDNVGMATEGRIPVRAGTPDDPNAFIDEWGTLPFGANPDETESIADVYGQETVDALRDGVAAVSRWGFGTVDAPVAGVVLTQGVVSSHLESLYAGTDPATVAANVAEEVTALQAEYGEQ